MELSLLSSEYMALGHEQAWEQIIGLIGICKRYRGDFVFLWHNNHLTSARDRELYLRVLGALSE
jgi:hypothetical protein